MTHPQPPGEVIASNSLARAVHLLAGAARGHTVVLSNRGVRTWFDLHPEEQLAMLALAAEVKTRLGADRVHVSFHDVTDEGGGPAALHVVPVAPNALPRSAHERCGLHDPRLITPRDDRFWLALVRHLESPSYDQIAFLVSFVMRSGMSLLAAPLDRALQRGAAVRVLTSDYMDVTDPDALQSLLDRVDEFGPERLEVRLYPAAAGSFHPKAYVFTSSDSSSAPMAFVGSSNLSRSALKEGVEWNLAVQYAPEVQEEFERLWTCSAVIRLAPPWLEQYRDRRRKPPLIEVDDGQIPLERQAEATAPPPRPRPVQEEGLYLLQQSRKEGRVAALAVLATGLGKTFLAAFDSEPYGRVLFLAHRKELLRQARDTFRLVRPRARMTMACDGHSDLSGEIVFASVQTLAGRLQEIAPDAFDYVVVDEFHHADAPTYRTILRYLIPRFLLGLTATPERMDGGDLVTLCDNNVLHVCDMVEGIRRDSLSPFHYRGVRDVVNYDGIAMAQGRFVLSELARAVSIEERARLALKEWQTSGARAGLGFCVDVDHADYMADWFRRHGIAAASVHSGSTSDGREESLERLRLGELKIVFSVDLFNEGLDMPCLDGVLMLRPTESPVVFLQQLGRGLRRVEGKVLRVIDLAANHKSFLSKATTLAELLSGRALTPSAAVRMLTGRVDPPPGIELDIDEIKGLLSELARHFNRNTEFNDWVTNWIDGYGERPRAIDAAMAGMYKDRSGWLTRLSKAAFLLGDEAQVLEAKGELVGSVDALQSRRVLAVVALREFVHEGGLSNPVPFEQLARAAHQRVLDDPALRTTLAGIAAFDWRQVSDPQIPDLWREKMRPLTEGERSLLELRGANVGMRLPAGPSDATDLVLELLEAKLWIHASAQSPVFRDDDGRELQAHFEVSAIDGGFKVTLHARGGATGAADQVNLHYDQGYDLFLTRAKARLLDAYVDSSTVRDMPLEARRLLDANEFPYVMASMNAVKQLRKQLGRAAGGLRQSRGAKGPGNTQKRVSFVVELPNVTSPEKLVELLAFGV